MKHKKELSLSIACFLLSFLCFMAWNQERDENLAAKICPAVLRLHVIGASNSDQDQQVKLQVKSFVVKQISSWNASSKDELVLKIQNCQTSLADAIRSYAASELGIPLDVKLSVSRTFFPTKSYGDLTFPQGMYDAVEIRLGAGRGRPVSRALLSGSDPRSRAGRIKGEVNRASGKRNLRPALRKPKCPAEYPARHLKTT